MGRYVQYNEEGVIIGVAEAVDVPADADPNVKIVATEHQHGVIHIDHTDPTAEVPTAELINNYRVDLDSQRLVRHER